MSFFFEASQISYSITLLLSLFLFLSQQDSFSLSRLSCFLVNPTVPPSAISITWGDGYRENALLFLVLVTHWVTQFLLL